MVVLIPVTATTVVVSLLAYYPGIPASSFICQFTDVSRHVGEGHMSKFTSLNGKLESTFDTQFQAVIAPRVPRTPRPATDAVSPDTSPATAPRLLLVAAVAASPVALSATRQVDYNFPAQGVF